MPSEEEEEEEPFDPLPDDYWKVDDAPQVAIDPDALVAALRSGDPRACSEAIAKFVQLGQDALPVLRALLEDDDPDVRVDARKAIEQIE